MCTMPACQTRPVVTFVVTKVPGTAAVPLHHCADCDTRKCGHCDTRVQSPTAVRCPHCNHAL
jgi:hypothetical protein